ncbi:MAG: hypothetical protein ACO36I_26715 [Candidatus Latescibacterota bacterium]
MTQDASLVNDDPYDSGWMIRVRLSDLSEIDDLMDADAYAGHIEA